MLLDGGKNVYLQNARFATPQKREILPFCGAPDTAGKSGETSKQQDLVIKPFNENVCVGGKTGENPEGAE